MKLFFTPPNDEMIKQKRSGLGDMCAAIYILENWGKIKKINHEVCGNVLFKKIIDLTEVEYVSWTDSVSDSVRMADTFVHPGEHWIIAFKRFVTNNGFLINFCKPLKSKIKPNKYFKNYNLVQFDGRLSNSNNFSLNKKEIKKIIKKHCKKNIGIIGGKDTEFYLGSEYEYFLGNLNNIIECLLGCDYFLGCDSGISHLAGMYGVKSHIFILNPEFDKIKDFYKIYKNNICHNNNIKLI
jgi:hypothetical protein